MLVKLALVAYFLALTLWMGGLIVLSFLVAPAVFKANPSKAQAGKTFGEILRRFNYVEFICAFILLVSYVKIYKVLNFDLLMNDNSVLWVIRIRALLILLMVAVLFIYGLYINPKLRQIRIEHNINFDEDVNDVNRTARSQFSKLHKLSEVLTVLNMIFGLALFVISCISIANILE